MGFQSFNLSDSAARSYADSVSRAMDQKASVRAVATTNVTLSGAQTIDGVSLIAGDRVLAAGQTLGQNNGIYVVGTPWVRASDADSSSEVTAGMVVPVTEGTTNADSLWELTTNDPITLATTPLSFSKLSSVALLQQLIDHIANTANPHAVTALQVGAYAWTWADAAARTAQAVTAGQVGLVGYQVDIQLEYALTSVSPTRWGPRDDARMGPARTALGFNNSGAASNVGNSIAVVSGTLSSRTATGTNAATRLNRSAYVSAASAGSVTLARVSTGHGILPTQGGRLNMQIVLASSANWRWFMGYASAVGASNFDPNTLLDCVGIGRNNQANAQLYNNDQAGLATTADLGAAFPGASDVGYELDVVTVDGTSYGWQVRNLITDAVVSGVLNTNLPTTTATLAWLLYACNNTDAVAVSMDLGSIRYWQRCY